MARLLFTVEDTFWSRAVDSSPSLESCRKAMSGFALVIPLG